LTHWRGDPDLIAVPEQASLDRLPEHQRAALPCSGQGITLPSGE
jgi:hypothetical protein